MEMKNMRKKVIALVMCGAMVFPLCANGGVSLAYSSEKTMKHTDSLSVFKTDGEEVPTEDATDVEEDDTDGVEGPLRYYVDDEKVTITSYTGNGTEVNVPSSIDGYPVCDIDYGAFSNTSIKSITLPDSLKSISSSAFENCEKLQSITIPSSVSYIGSYAFYGCDRLKKVTFNTNKLSSIPSSCFEFCKKLQSITIPSSVKRIGSNAFYRCTKLSSVTLGKKVKTIESGAFRENYALTSISFPAKVRRIEDEAFYHCTKLKSVTFKSKNTKFTTSFGRCSALTKIVIPKNMASVPERAFYGCTSLKKVTLSPLTKLIKRRAFYGCESLKTITLRKKIYAIGDGAFEGSGLKKIKLNAKLQYIGNGAFKGTRVKKVKLPGKVSYIGNRVFKDCERLVSISIPASVKGLNPGAFGGCLSLKSITVSSGNKNYSSANGVLFDKNKTMLLQYPMNKTSRSYSVPGSVSVIRSSAFEGNDHLMNLSVGAASIHNHAFAEMKNLKSVTIRSGVRTIAASVFEGDSRLTTVNMASTVTSIGSRAFADTKIKSIMIPSGLTKLADDVFSGCNRISAFYGSTYGKYSVRDGVLYTNGGKTLLKYPSRKSSSSFSVPEQVTKVSGEAFKNVLSLKKLDFSKNIKYLTYACIYNCKKLKQVVFAGGTKLKSGAYAIESCDKLAVIVGPKQYLLDRMADNAGATLITL